MLVARPFYVVRHAQTTDNALGLISGGGSNPDLSEAGKAQARLARTIYLAISPPPSRIVVSSLKRTHQTALLIAEHDDFLIEPGLDERHLGELDGKITEVEQKLRKILPGEESGVEQATRVIAAINRHLEALEYPLFVCHGGTIRRILETTGLAHAISVDNAQIYKMTPGKTGWLLDRL